MKILIQKNINIDGLGEPFNNYSLITLTFETLSIFSWYFHYLLKGSLSLALIMCQITRKPGPYATAICWWAQAVFGR